MTNISQIPRYPCRTQQHVVLLKRTQLSFQDLERWKSVSLVSHNTSPKASCKVRTRNANLPSHSFPIHGDTEALGAWWNLALSSLIRRKQLFASSYSISPTVLEHNFMYTNEYLNNRQRGAHHEYLMKSHGLENISSRNDALLIAAAAGHPGFLKIRPRRQFQLTLC